MFFDDATCIYKICTTEKNKNEFLFLNVIIQISDAMFCVY